MDFGDILDKWDKETAKPAGKKALRAAESQRKADSADRDSEAAARVPAPPAAEERRVDPLTAWLRTNPVLDKDAGGRDPDGEVPAAYSAERRRRVKAKAPDAVIDLHGLTRDEAWMRLSAFFADARRQGLEKVQVIHGKGNHSAGEAVLKRATREFLERCPFAGEHGAADNKSGGSGATWVVLKEKK